MSPGVTPDIELVTKCLEYFATKDPSLLWSAARIDEIVRADPEHGWSLTLQLIEAATTDFLLAIIAAGPLEDLLGHHGILVVDRVETYARRDSKFRNALSCVWGAFPGQSGVRARVDKAVGRI
jgi:hypothetical protein